MNENELAVWHEACHLAVAKMRRIQCDAVTFRFDPNDDSIADCEFTFSDDDWRIDDAIISVAPLAIGDEPSESDVEGHSETMLACARLIVLMQASEIKAQAETIIKEILFPFLGGQPGRILNPLGG